VRHGRVRVSWTLLPDGGLRLLWTESGGPPVHGRPARRGFGASLIETTVTRQLEGVTQTEWAPGGVVVEVVLPAEHLRLPVRPRLATAG
jgi:two-component sensor histidine kinase